MIAWFREQLSSPLRLIVLICLSPFLLMSIPVLVFALPGALVVYAAWSLFGPVGHGKKVIRSEPIGESRRDAKEGPPHRNVLFKSELVEDKDGLHTIPDLMRATCEKYGSHEALGSRRLLKIAEKDVEVVVEGKNVTKKHKIPWLSDYEFITFTQFGQKITDLGHGLMEGTQHPMKFGDKVSLFAGTRPEWQITAQAAFEQGLVVVTVYPSLGPDALSFSLNQTKCSHLVTQASLLETVLKSTGQLNGALKCIIVMDEVAPGKLQQYQKECGMEILLWTDVMKRGGELAQKAISSKKAPTRKPKPEDHAVIMYTSGSTGQPKGVIMSHRNIVAAIGGIAKIPPDPLNEKDVYIAYLPLAHVLELTAEMTILAFGGSLGYSSPQTLRDDGACDAEGHPAGDLGKLRPTLMAAVPMILDRLRAAVQDQVAKSNIISRTLFNTAYAIKKRRYLSGQPSPILDKIVFQKVANKFGGRLRYLLSGGAPLSGETHQFINIVMCAPVMQGYGLTETLCGGTITHPSDVETGNAGAPVACCQVKLQDEKEMGYTHLDKPRPRGQIMIGGPNVSVGYYEQEKLTAESYHTDSDGVRYFATGDIGEWQDNGTLKIIDRKKDLVKLAHGEYIAVGNLESKYAHCPLVDNIAVIGNSEHNAPIALIAPNHAKLLDLAKELGVSGDINAVCADANVQKAVQKELVKVADQNRFEKWERVAAVRLYADSWTPQNGLLTEAMKLKRFEIQKRFKADIDEMYKGVP